MKNLNVVVGVLVGLVIGYAIGSQMAPGNATAAVAPSVAPTARPAAAAAPQGPAEVFKVAVGDAPTKGPADAKVTIVEWSDFECPFCGRVIDTLKQIERAYAGEVRIAFKHNPLPMHPNAPYAAKASIAAGRQGKFWEMHDKLFEANLTLRQNPRALVRENVDALAQGLGLDMERFRQDVESADVNSMVQADQAQARQVGANGTPAFFINGARFTGGAAPFDTFKPMIDEALRRADAELKKGTPKAKLYEALIKDGRDAPPPPPPAPPPPPQAAKIDVDDAQPSKGPKTAKITMVVWSDFQCPFCARVEPTLKQIEDTYKGEVRMVWRNQPLSFHPNAMPAAKAAMAAHKQGKFWQMHEKMFANQSGLNEANYEAWAKEIGLDLPRWKADKESPEIAQVVQKDIAAGNAVGADGTPTFFVNGKLISGAVPFAEFKAVIDEQLKAADELLKKGTKKEKLYEALLAENVKSAGGPKEEARVQLDVGASPVLGSAKAPVTMFIFSDFQCPFCARVEPTLAELRKGYGDKLRLVWKNQPLGMHPQAQPAAEAAMAAHEQGKFWDFHDKLFANATRLGPDLYEQVAQEVGLDVSKWKQALSSGKYKAQIAADSAKGNEVGAGGTPTFFINGKKLVGALSVDAFKAVIDAELAVAKR